MFFISFSRILPLDEFFYVAKSYQMFQNQYKFSMIIFIITENWRIDKISLRLKLFCFIEKLIEWQNSRRAYKKQTLEAKIFFILKILRYDTIFWDIIFQVLIKQNDFLLFLAPFLNSNNIFFSKFFSTFYGKKVD